MRRMLLLPIMLLGLLIYVGCSTETPVDMGAPPEVGEPALPEVQPGPDVPDQPVPDPAPKDDDLSMPDEVTPPAEPDADKASPAEPDKPIDNSGEGKPATNTSDDIDTTIGDTDKDTTNTDKTTEEKVDDVFGSSGGESSGGSP